MHPIDIKNKLAKHTIRFGNCDYYPATMVIDELNKLQNEIIHWSEDDFKQMALESCNYDNAYGEYYNELMFAEARDEMIRHHDAQYGISWETVKYYLNSICKIKEYNLQDKLYKKNKKDAV